MDPSSPLLRFEPGLLIWEVGAFLVLLLVLRKIAWNRLLKALDEREKRIHESLEQARKAQRDAEKFAAENRQRIDEAIQTSEQIDQQAREQAEHVHRQILEEGRAEARRVIEQGMRRLEAEQRSALREVRFRGGRSGDPGGSSANSSLA